MPNWVYESVYSSKFSPRLIIKLSVPQSYIRSNILVATTQRMLLRAACTQSSSCAVKRMSQRHCMLCTSTTSRSLIIYSLLVVQIMHVVIAGPSIEHERCKERNMASSCQTKLVKSSTQSSNAVSQDTSLQVNHVCSSTDAAVLHCPACIQCLSSIPSSPKFCTWHASMRSPTSMKSQLLDHG